MEEGTLANKQQQNQILLHLLIDQQNSAKVNCILGTYSAIVTLFDHPKFSRQIVPSNCNNYFFLLIGRTYGPLYQKGIFLLALAK